jgi:hypothetical protein
MTYQPAFDIHAVPRDLLRHVQPGQWVYATDRSVVGRFFGVRRSGVVVVAWQGNARNADGGARGYWATLRTYARSV